MQPEARWEQRSVPRLGLEVAHAVQMRAVAEEQIEPVPVHHGVFLVGHGPDSQTAHHPRPNPRWAIWCLRQLVGEAGGLHDHLEQEVALHGWAESGSGHPWVRGWPHPLHHHPHHPRGLPRAPSQPSGGEPCQEEPSW